MERILLYSSLISTETCLSISSISIAIINSFCSREVDGAAVFFGTVTTNSAAMTQDVVTALTRWYQSGPALILNGIPFEVDLDCGLVLQADPQVECSNITSTTPGILIHPTTIIIITFSTVGGLGLLTVVVLLSIMWIRTCHKKKKTPVPPAQFIRY